MVKMARLVEDLWHMPEDLSSDPQPPCTRLSMATHTRHSRAGEVEVAETPEDS